MLTPVTAAGSVMSAQPKVVSVDTSARELGEKASPVNDSKIENIYEQMQ